MFNFCIGFVISVLSVIVFAEQPSADVQKIYDESGQYQIDIQASVNACLQKVHAWQQAHQSKHDVNMCYVGVFDIDETLLSNIGLIRESQYHFTLDYFLKHVPDSQPSVIAPTLALLKAMRAAGMRIVLITGRTESICEKTREQLTAAGVEPQDYDALYCSPDTEEPGGKFKANMRMQIEASGCKIAFNVSDQPKDLQGKAPGEICLLPNPFYTV
jgi:predicted secreted acid phosphatase